MKKLLPFVLFILIFLPQLFFHSMPIYADEAMDKFQALQKQIEELTAKLNETRSKAISLANQITYMDNQIKLTTLEITKTKAQIEEVKKEVEDLTGRIFQLEGTLTNVSEMLIDRVVATYKTGQISAGLLFLSTNGLSDLVIREKYLQLVQSHDKKLMFEIQHTKADYEEQKQLLEKKRIELNTLAQKLDTQQKVLGVQKIDKETLLVVTRNDEKKFQQLLSSAKAELEAINAIVAGKGVELAGGHVNGGDRIASVISGSSCNSSGGHLHFMVTDSSVVKNPFSHLSSNINYQNCSGSSCGSSDADSFNPSGDWSWPIDAPLKFNQGFGSTWAVSHYSWLPYSFHNGIDVSNDSSSTVKAVKAGNLYRGSYTGISSCRLQYVRVDHDDSNIDTLYLHVNY